MTCSAIYLRRGTAVIPNGGSREAAHVAEDPCSFVGLLVSALSWRRSAAWVLGPTEMLLAPFQSSVKKKISRQR